MSVLKLICLSTIFFILANSSAAQSRMAGRVIEVIDGKTMVIDSGGRKLTVEIQFIEVPEPEQPLHQTVRDHLAKLALGRSVEFDPRGFSGGRSIGRLNVEKTDIAVQLLRDGAAWHLDPEKTGQEPADAAAYAYHQNQARVDGLGVWGIKGMITASEFRAEKQKASQPQAGGVPKTPSDKLPADPAQPAAKSAPRRSGPWSDINPYLKDPGPLVHGYNAATKTGYVGTSLIGVKEKEGESKAHQTAVDITYLYRQEDQGGRKGSFIVNVVSSSDEWRFLKTNTLTVHVDDKKYTIGRPTRTAAREDGKLIEKLTYEVDRSTIEKIVFGGDVFIKIGEYTLQPTPGIQLILHNMLQVAD